MRQAIVRQKTNRSAVALPKIHQIVVSPDGLNHQFARWTASDMKFNDGWETVVVRLPRRLFRGKRAYHNTWLLMRGGLEFVI